MALSYNRATGFAGCCGLEIISGLSNYSVVQPHLTNTAKVAVTNAAQNGEGVGRALEQVGFRNVGAFFGSSNNTLTLWLRDKVRQPPRKRSPLSTTHVSRRTGRPVTQAFADRNPGRVRSIASSL